MPPGVAGQCIDTVCAGREHGLRRRGQVTWRIGRFPSRGSTATGARSTSPIRSLCTPLSSRRFSIASLVGHFCIWVRTRRDWSVANLLSRKHATVAPVQPRQRHGHVDLFSRSSTVYYVNESPEKQSRARISKRAKIYSYLLLRIEFR